MNSPHRVAESAPPRVLIADADAAARAMHRESLSSAGCDIVEASDGREALVHALVRNPSLVITELDLPIVDGVALCEILRRDRGTSRVPILVVTRETNPALHERARQAGADAVLEKSAALATLLQEAERLLRESHERRGRSVAATRHVAEQLKRSVLLIEGSGKRAERTRSHAHQRFTTTTPPTLPPGLSCPVCARPLKYRVSHIGGVNAEHPEQWDYYQCATCGEFRYRQRTRKLRRVV